VGLDPQPITLVTLTHNQILLTAKGSKKQKKKAEGKEVIFDDISTNLVMDENSVEVHPNPNPNPNPNPYPNPNPNPNPNLNPNPNPIMSRPVMYLKWCEVLPAR
jgi:hypothetical protein